MNILLLRASFLIPSARAQVFNGGGLDAGVNTAAQINGPVHDSLRGVILSLFYQALSFLALAGVVMMVIAGFYLVLSAGNDTAKDTAKKMILYVVIGLIIVFIARSVVGFFLNGLP